MTKVKAHELMVAVALPVLLPLRLLWQPKGEALHEERRPARPRSLVERIVLRLAAQDWLLLGYLVTLFYEVVFGVGARRGLASACLAFQLIAFVMILWIVRGSRRSALAPLLYRFGILLTLLGTFFELQWILPAASGPPVDTSLHALDLRLFGLEPALVWDRFVRPATTEWFSFFYYGYFVLVAVCVLPPLFLGRNQRFLITFGFGFLWLYCIGHVVYTIVPAYGPYANLAFRHPLEGGVWWPLVKRTVASVDGSARTDVFPSLHTAGPAFLTLYAFVHRHEARRHRMWPLLGFIATQIIIATMFLRWHYLIDVCAGLVLAASAIGAGNAALWWDEARVAAGGDPAWPLWGKSENLRFSSVRQLLQNAPDRAADADRSLRRGTGLGREHNLG